MILDSAMRPAKTAEGGLSAPLNRILGTEANVRVLRSLSRAEEPLQRPEVARRARLDESGVRRALDALAVEGIVEAAEGGGHVRVRLRDAHPLAGALRALFQAEAQRAQDVLAAIRKRIRALSRRPISLWIVEGGRLSAEGLDIVRIGLLAPPREVDALARELRIALREVEREYDLAVEVIARTEADLATADAEEYGQVAAARPLEGREPASFLALEAPDEAPRDPQPARPQARTHAQLDRRAVALGRAIGDRLVRDPSLIRRARGYVRRRMAEAAPGERLEMEEWEGILDTMPPARLRAFLTDPGQRATRLRQSLPFLDVLTPAEREAILRKAGA